MGYFSAENKDIETIYRGQPVAIHPSGSGVWKASASDDTRNAVGLMSEDTEVGSSNNVTTDDVFTQADWSAVVGATNLQGGEIYFLDVVSGHMTTSPAGVSGEVVQILGRAISNIALDIEIEGAVLL